MWTVGSEIRNGVPVYYVMNLKTKERKRGEFDCERSAQIFADYLNESEE